MDEYIRPPEFRVHENMPVPIKIGEWKIIDLVENMRALQTRVSSLEQEVSLLFDVLREKEGIFDEEGY